MKAVSEVRGDPELLAVSMASVDMKSSLCYLDAKLYLKRELVMPRGGTVIPVRRYSGIVPPSNETA
ncbi:hypothetical protein D3C78_1839130 [compost metagenome]